MTSYGTWAIVLRRIAFVGMAWVLVIALSATLKRLTRPPRWQRAAGTIQDTRIIADHGTETGWGGQLMWKAEYRVSYTVVGREYAVWADSGVRGDSEADLRLALPRLRPQCQVKYNPRRPEESLANCR